MNSEFTEEELLVAQVLCELPSLISSSQFHPHNFNFSVKWSSKKRRSALIFRGARSPSSSSPLKTKVKALSPATPLSFSPSESDDKSKRSSKKVPKFPLKTKEELLETIQQLTQQKSELQREVEKVGDYYDKLKTKNLMLKAKQIELNTKKENQNMERSLNLSLEPIRPKTEPSAGACRDDNQSHTTGAVTMRMPLKPSLSVVDGSTNQHFESPSGPLGDPNEFSLPDLNVAINDSYSVVLDSHNNILVVQEMDMAQKQGKQNMMNSKALATQARQKRIQIQRLKHSVSGSNKRPFSLLDSTNRL